MSEVCIGIDLGTTFSVVGLWENNQVTVIPYKGKKLVPSCVSFARSSKEVNSVGQPAVNKAKSNIKNTIFGAKRIIGRDFSDESIKGDIEKWPFKVVRGEDNKCLIEITVDNKPVLKRPEEVSASVLRKLKESASEYVGKEVKNAVITVPAYFMDAQRQATIDAGSIAGLNVIKIINEPTAAALAYGVLKKFTDKKTLLVFDLGGGTFDVSIVTVDDGIYDVKAIGGDSHLGGEDFDNLLIEYVLGEFVKANPSETPQKDDKFMFDLRRMCNELKHTLSSEPMGDIDCEFNEISFKMNVTRATFESLCDPLFKRCMEKVQYVLKEACMTQSQVDEILLVGGSTYIPKVSEMLEDYFKKKPLTNINADEVVAYGAAIQAACLTLPPELKSTSPLAQVKLLDITAHSYGVQSGEDEMSVIIKRQSPVPIECTRQYTPAENFQTAIRVRIFQGESTSVTNNTELGFLEISNLPRVPKRDNVFDITFVISGDAVLSAKVKHTTKPELSKDIQINLQKGQMSEAEKLKAVQEASQHVNLEKNEEETRQLYNNIQKRCTQLQHANNKPEHIIILLEDTRIMLEKPALSLLTLREVMKKLESCQEELHGEVLEQFPL